MLELNNISASYGEGQHLREIIRDISLRAMRGEFVALVGPSGSGKSTLLKCVAGLLPLSSGTITLNGKNVTSPGKDRGMVFQNFSLFPWLTVRQNMAFGPLLRHLEIGERIEEMLRVMDLTECADLFPSKLSGGMQQRVAIARTLLNDPDVLLMDEPFGSLDELTRSRMQELLVDVWEKRNPAEPNLALPEKTIIFVTHSVEEAVFLADTIYVLSDHPMQIKESFSVPFARPRRHELKRDPTFFAFQTHVRQALEKPKKKNPAV